MRAVLTRVKSASVTIDGNRVGEIGKGFLILLGVGPADTREDVRYLAEKALSLRIFEDEAGKMNRSLLDVKGSMLIVSQFTLFADTTQGRRPYFGNAAPPQLADELYEKFKAEAAKFVPVACGKFGADMQVSLCNDGPVTIMLEAIRNDAGKITLI